jgi:tRNA G10  N-methylase Trm11
LNAQTGSAAYIYTYACHEEEWSLCQLELRTLFNLNPNRNYLASPLNIDPSRSPFIKLQLEIFYTGDSIQDIAQQVEALELQGAAFKVIYIENDELAKVEFAEQRAMEREIGRHIRGKAEMRKPEQVFGMMELNDRWFFGECRKNKAVWLKHTQKPQNYSTALNTRVARAAANIAAPNPHEVKVIDPCCGIGTVLIEALSMGIDIIGSDLNPLAVVGARVNLAHFGFADVVTVADIRQLNGSYDAAIMDMPYNLCSVITTEEQLMMLTSARKLARKVIVITTEDIDSIIESVGFTIEDRGFVRKGNFSRQIIVCI